MTGTAQALSEWLSQFGLPVYGADDVPYDADMPYITATVREPTWDQKTDVTLQAWYYTKTNAPVIAMGDRIAATIGVGVRIPCTGGLLVLWPGGPFEILTEKNVRRAVIHVSMNAYHCPGV